MGGEVGFVREWWGLYLFAMVASGSWDEKDVVCDKGPVLLFDLPFLGIAWTGQYSGRMNSEYSRGKPTHRLWRLQE